MLATPYFFIYSINMMIDKIKSNIDKYDLISPGERLLVCVSGGPDSVLLLHCLKNLQKNYKSSLFVAHVNHNLRGSESDAEEKFVFNLCARLKVPFLKCSVATEFIAGKEKLSIEETARNLRYNFFRNICHMHKIKKIILAHTKDDQVETIIMRLLRGTGIKGLGGMHFETAQGKLRLIRPMLDIEKLDILDYLKKSKIKYKIDSSNLKTDYFRNKVRLEIIPMLKKYSPKIQENIFRIGVVAKQAEDILQAKVRRIFSKIVIVKKDNLFNVNKQLFLRLPLVLRSEVIRKIISELKGNLNGIDFRHVQIVNNFICNVDSPGRYLDLPKGIFIEKFRKRVCFGEKGKKTISPVKMSSHFLRLGVELKILGLNMSLKAVKIKRPSDLKSLKKHSADLEYFDLDKMAFPLEVRIRKTGDLFHPLGSKGKKKLKKFFIDQKMEEEQKDSTGLIVTDGMIAWVIGMRLGEAFKITKNTKRIVKIQARFMKSNGAAS